MKRKYKRVKKEYICENCKRRGVWVDKTGFCKYCTNELIKPILQQEEEEYLKEMRHEDKEEQDEIAP